MAATQLMKHPLICFLKIILFLHHLPSPLDALSFTYPNFLNPQNLNFSGDAFPYRGILSITKEGANSSVGRVTYAQEFHLWDHATKRVANFSSEFSFNITSYHQENGGDGIAFFLTANGAQIPDASAGACLGLIGHCEDFKPQEKPIVAVEIDTFKNLWDPDNNHIGINVNTIQSEANVSWPNTFKDGSVLKMRLDYDPQRKIFEVYMAPLGHLFPGQASLSYDIDLPEILPEWVTIGFSGATGAAMELHYIHSWDFQSSEVIEPAPPASPHHQCVPYPVNCKGARNWLLFVLFLIGVLLISLIVVTVCMYVGYKLIKGKDISWKAIIEIIAGMLPIIAACFGLSGCINS